MWMLIAVGMAVAATHLALTNARGLHRLDAVSARRLPAWLGERSGAVAPRFRALVAGGVACASLAAVGLSLAGLALAVVGAVIAYVALSFLGSGKEQARRRRLSLELPDALDLLAASLAAGAPIGVATREVAQVADPTVAHELMIILARSAVGESDASAWALSRDRPVVGSVARDVARAVASGAALTACLRRHAAEGRRERQATLEARAKAVSISAVLPMSVCFLPAFVLVGIVPLIAGIALTLLH